MKPMRNILSKDLVSRLESPVQGIEKAKYVEETEAEKYSV